MNLIYEREISPSFSKWYVCTEIERFFTLLNKIFVLKSAYFSATILRIFYIEGLGSPTALIQLDFE